MLANGYYVGKWLLCWCGRLGHGPSPGLLHSHWLGHVPSLTSPARFTCSHDFIVSGTEGRRTADVPETTNKVDHRSKSYPTKLKGDSCLDRYIDTSVFSGKMVFHLNYRGIKQAKNSRDIDQFIGTHY